MNFKVSFAGVLASALMASVAMGADVTSDTTSDVTDVAPGDVSHAVRFRQASLVTGGALAAIMVYGAHAWWIDAELEPFHFRDTGSFQRWTYSGGSDKLGHTYALYIITRSLSSIYESIGLKKHPRILLASGAAMIAGTGIELMDSITKFGFEYGDVVANSVGIGVATLAELYPEFDDTFGFRIGWVPTPEYLAHPQSYLKSVNDFGGMIFYADLKSGGVVRRFGGASKAADFLLLGANWGTVGYSPECTVNGRRAREICGQRNLGMHVSFAVDQLFAKTMPEGKLRYAFERFTRYFALPFTTLGIAKDLNHDTWRLHFGVAQRLNVGL